MAGKKDEQPVGEPLIIGWNIWDFYRDVESDVYVARLRGDEDKPHVAARYEELRERLTKLYEGERGEHIYDD